MVCPRQRRPDGPLCRIEVFEPWSQALAVSRNSSGSKCCIGCTVRGAISSTRAPRNDGTTRGTFSLRSPVRPNPIGASIASLIKVEGSTLPVRGLDCLDDTPLLDLKPDRKLFTPLVPPTPGDSDVGDP